MKAAVRDVLFSTINSLSDRLGASDPDVVKLAEVREAIKAEETALHQRSSAYIKERRKTDKSYSQRKRYKGKEAN